MKSTLQKIIFPNKEICNVSELYFRTEHEVYDEEQEKIVFNVKRSIEEKISFDTYFNSFNLFKWKKYTKIENLFLEFYFKGKLRMKIYNSRLKNNKEYREILYNKLYNSKEEKKEEILIDISKINKGDIFFEIIPYEINTEVYDISYFTQIDSDKLNEIILGIGTCTYFKEEYIYNNFNIIQKYVNNEEEKKINYYIVDNGKSVDPSKLNHVKNLKVISSKNMGASGGFSRVFYEAIKDNNTHVISLDDDIQINPYAINIIYKFLQLLKDEYLEYGIGGAMLIYDRKYIQHDAGSYLEENKILGIETNLDLRDYDNVLKNSIEKYNSNIFNGFWFCCYPIRVLREKGLTYPFFMKGDDVEIGVRIYDEKFITLNSICVWHEDFFKKFTPIYTNFYETRNLLIINSLIFKEYSSFKAYILVAKRILRELLFFRYEGCDLIFKAVDEFLKGSNAIINKDNEKFVKENSHIYKMKEFKELKSEVKCLSKIYNKINVFSKSKKMRLFRILTFNGQFLPKIFLKKQIEVPIVVATFDSVRMSKKIFHYDLENERGYVTRLSKIKMLKNFLKLIKYYFVFMLRYNKAKKDYISKREEMTSIEFWDKKFKES